MRPDEARRIDRMSPNADNLAGSLTSPTGRKQTMIKFKLVTLAWLTTAVLGSVFARDVAPPGDCIKTQSTRCCQEISEFCVFFFDCGICCGRISFGGHNSSYLKLVYGSPGWDLTTLFAIDPSGPHCDFYPPACNMFGECSLAVWPITIGCVGFLEPGGQPNCP